MSPFLLELEELGMHLFLDQALEISGAYPVHTTSL
jgi:hypothetical protein